MIKICILLEDGDYFYTKFNGTCEEAEEYYVGKSFNMGIVDDDMQKCIGIYFVD